MANEIQRKYRTTQTVQASAAITADTFSTGSETAMDNETANYDGCDYLDVYINITSAAATTGSAEIWMAASRNSGTGYAEYEYALSAAVVASYTGDIHMGTIAFVCEEMKAKIKAIDYGFTASLLVVPVVPEVQ